MTKGKDYAPIGLKFKLDGLFLRCVQLQVRGLCTSCTVARLLLCVWSQKTVKLNLKKTQGDNICRLRSRKDQHFGYAEGRSLRAATGPWTTCFPPSVCLSLAGHPARFNGDTQAAAASPAQPMNQMRQVQLRWSPVKQQAWVCSSPHYCAAYLMSPKGEKRKRRITVKYLQNQAVLRWLLRAASLPPPAPSADLWAENRQK